MPAVTPSLGSREVAWYSCRLPSSSDPASLRAPVERIRFDVTDSALEPGTERIICICGNPELVLDDRDEDALVEYASCFAVGFCIGIFEEEVCTCCCLTAVADARPGSCVGSVGFFVDDFGTATFEDPDADGLLSFFLSLSDMLSEQALLSSSGTISERIVKSQTYRTPGLTSLVS